MPLTADICWGSPGADQFAITDARCQKVPFQYGDPLITVDLQ